ncbi:MAG: hypothetical protein ACM3QZ_06360 [Solirubrobacterales bacterium]
MEIYGLVLPPCDEMRWPTDVKKVFQALDGSQNGYNWLITGHAFTVLPQEQPDGSMERVLGRTMNWGAMELFQNPTVWISGEELSEMIDEYPLQFVTGVFAAFPNGSTFNPWMLDSAPAGGADELVAAREPRIRYPEAEIEIICDNMNRTVFLTKDVDSAKRFRALFPAALDLRDYTEPAE